MNNESETGTTTSPSSTSPSSTSPSSTGPSIGAKEKLIENIKEWIKLDNEIKKVKTELKEKTNKKKELTGSLVEIMKKNEIDCFDINGGSLLYKQQKSHKPISAKYLASQLHEYYKEQPDMANELTKKLLDNREEVVRDEIKRKIKT